MDDTRADAYLARIAAERPVRPDIDGLRALQRAHLRAVPFENLSIHLGERIELTEEALLAKVVDRRRGGFCYELNGAFAALLTALGYRVTMLSARVFGGPPHSGRVGPPFDHLALRVDLDEPWLADVGFGAFSLEPLRLAERGAQSDPAGTFRIVPADTEQPELDVLRDDAPQYRLDQRPYALSDFTPTCWWQQTSPDSHFTASITCSRATESGRITLSGNRLIRTVDGRREETALPTDAEVLTAYREHFGMTFDQVPAVRERAVFSS